MSTSVEDKTGNGVIPDYDLDEIKELISKIDFFQDGSDECLERYCENLQTTLGYCRYHYIKNWKEIKHKKAIFEDGKFVQIVLELLGKYTLKNLESMAKDLSCDKVFFQVLKDLNIESNYQDDELSSDDIDDDITVETRTYGGSSRHYEDEDEF